MRDEFKHLTKHCMLFSLVPQKKLLTASMAQLVGAQALTSDAFGLELELSPRMHLVVGLRLGKIILISKTLTNK